MGIIDVNQMLLRHFCILAIPNPKREHDTYIALRECARLLKPGGRLVLLDSLQHGDQGGLRRTFGTIPE